MNQQTIIIIGAANGTYHNDEISKDFAGKLLVMARPDGSTVVQNMSNGIRPICYIGEGAELSLAKNVIDAELCFTATTEDGQILQLQFDEIYSLCGVPGDMKDENSAAICILKAVSSLEGKYGRVRIARLLTGSTSKQVLTMGVEELRHYGVLRGMNQREVLHLADWLLDEKYLKHDEEEEAYPTLMLTALGRDTLKDLEEGKNGNISVPSDD